MRAASYEIAGGLIDGQRVVRCDVGTLPPALAGEALRALGTMTVVTDAGGLVAGLLVAVDHGDVITAVTRTRRMVVYYDRRAGELRTLDVLVKP